MEAKIRKAIREGVFEFKVDFETIGAQNLKDMLIMERSKFKKLLSRRQLFTSEADLSELLKSIYHDDSTQFVTL